MSSGRKTAFFFGSVMPRPPLDQHKYNTESGTQEKEIHFNNVYCRQSRSHRLERSCRILFNKTSLTASLATGRRRIRRNMEGRRHCNQIQDILPSTLWKRPTAPSETSLSETRVTTLSTRTERSTTRTQGKHDKLRQAFVTQISYQ